jgi:hypothetical protein
MKYLELSLHIPAPSLSLECTRSITDASIAQLMSDKVLQYTQLSIVTE